MLFLDDAVSNVVNLAASGAVEAGEELAVPSVSNINDCNKVISGSFESNPGSIDNNLVRMSVTPDTGDATPGCSKTMLGSSKIIPGSSQTTCGNSKTTSGSSKTTSGETVGIPAETEESSANISASGNWLSYVELMNQSYPPKSKIVYLKAFKLFERFLKSKNQWSPNVVPTDLQVLNYFHYLRNELKWAPTTLWSTYARINAVMKRVYGVSLNSFSRVSEVLKSYESGHVVKQAGIFTPQQIEDFVSDPQLSSKYWLVRKVVCLVGYYGGFRNVELKSLKFENIEHDSMGYWFHFVRRKQRGRVEETSICIPRRQPDWIPVVSDSSRMGLDFDPASLLDLYFAEIESDLHCSREELKGDFFRATHGMKGQKFTQLTIGKNTIGRVGVQVATELCLPRPEMYTGHCWRRSCGTSASDSGVNVTTLMAMMGWSNPKTAMVYVKKSRMTSLSMSLYLANVQRSNCPNPFPRSPAEKRLVLDQVAKSVAAKVSKNLVASSFSEVLPQPVDSGLKLEDLEVELMTQDLIRDIEAEESNRELSFESEEIDSSASFSTSTGSTTIGASVPKKELKPKEVGESSVASVSSNLSNQLTVVDPRLVGILQNLQNTGNMTIHFHFDSNKK